MRLLPFLLLACDTGDTGDTDTGTADTGDTADTSDTSETADTEDTGPPPDLGFDVDEGATGTTLTLTPLDMSSLGTETLIFGDTWLSAPIEGDPALVYAGEPPASALVEVDPTEAPGMLVAMYVPALHADTDGDGLRSGDETYLALGMWWVAYVTGDIAPNFVAAGVVEGWNAVFVFSETGPQFGSAMATPLPTSLLPDTTLTLAGTYTGDPDDVGLAAFPWNFLQGEPVEELLYDAPIEPNWSITLDGEPPADHFVFLEFLGAEGSLEIVASYADNNASGSYDGGDMPLNGPCYAGVPVGAVWWPGPTELMSALQLTMQGMRPGWLAFPMGDGGGVLTEEQAQSLVIDDSCVFQ